MTPTAKKIVFVALTVSVIGIGAWWYLKKKKAALGPHGEAVAPFAATGTVPGSWKGGSDGDDVNIFHIWGYAVTNASNGADPVPYPHIKIFTADGKQYGAEYIGDKGGVYSLWVPSPDYTAEVTASGYMIYRNPASVITNGYKLLMKKTGEV